MRRLGRGGQARVAEASGLIRNTLIVGVSELAGGAGPSDRVRREGAGRKRAVDLDPELLVVLDEFVEPGSRGDPMSPLRWTGEVDPVGRAGKARARGRRESCRSVAAQPPTHLQGKPRVG